MRVNLKEPFHPEIEICILAGGLSSRMGREKAALRLGRRSLLGHVRAAVQATGHRVRVIRVDLRPRCGPLGGVYTGLVTSRLEAVLFLSCDMPFLSPAWMMRVIESLGKRSLAVFSTGDMGDGFPFVLRRRVLAVVEKRLAERQYSLQGLAEELKARRLTAPIRRRNEFFNVNTPEDYAKAREIWASMSQG